MRKFGRSEEHAKNNNFRGDFDARCRISRYLRDQSQHYSHT
ncbi:MAG: hypothetical protein ACRDRT_09520 [Pseudonocardiaceae bacterium]